jgi:hypothetical protein
LRLLVGFHSTRHLDYHQSFYALSQVADVRGDSVVTLGEIDNLPQHHAVMAAWEVPWLYSAVLSSPTVQNLPAAS